MFGESNLVVLNENEHVETFKLNGQIGTIKCNKFYTCNKFHTGYYIGCTYFDKDIFEKLFITAHERILNDFKTIGILTEDNKPISKKSFIEKSDIHTYGNGQRALKIVLFRTYINNHLIYY